MRWTQIYDPERKPEHWSEIIQPGQYVVFACDAHTRLARDPDGTAPSDGKASVAICDDLSAARDLSHTLVTAHPDLCCEIYNHNGKAGDPVQVIYNPAVAGRYTGRPVARRETWRGAALCLFGSVFILVDVRHSLTWIWGYVIGLKLFIIGSVFLVRGLLGLYEHRE